MTDQDRIMNQSALQRVLNTYRSSKHSLFTLVQNEISQKSIQQLNYMDYIDQHRIQKMEQSIEKGEASKSLQKLNNQYKKMQNKLNKLMNADHAKNIINLIENQNLKYMIQGNHSLFFKVERKSVIVQALRIIAKMEYGDAKIYGSSTFEFPNYANNQLKNTSLVGETFYFQPQNQKAKTLYLSIEAFKRTSIQLSVKFVRLADIQKKFDPNVSVFSNQTPTFKEQQQLSQSPRRKKQSPVTNFFKAFINGKQDEQARIQVLSRARQHRLQKQVLVASLKKKLLKDLHFAKSGPKSQRMKNYFDKEREKIEIAQKRKFQNEQSNRKHKVALLNRNQIRRYLQSIQDEKLKSQRIAANFSRVWIASCRACSAMNVIAEAFRKRRDAEFLSLRQHMAAFQIQIYYRKYIHDTMSILPQQRALINFRCTLKVRSALNADYGNHMARSYVFKFLSDNFRIQQFSKNITEFVQSLIRIQMRWKQKLLKNVQRVSILQYYVDRLCDCYVNLKKKRISDGKLKRKIDKKITLIMSFDSDYLEFQLKKLYDQKKEQHRDLRAEVRKKLQSASEQTRKFSKVIHFLIDWLEQPSLNIYQKRIQAKLLEYFTEHYKKYINQKGGNSSGNFMSYRRQGTVNLIQRASTRQKQELKMMQAYGRTNKGLTVTVPNKRVSSSSGTRKKHSKSIHRQTITNQEELKSAVGLALGQKKVVEDDGYDKYVKDLLKRAIFAAKFDFVPEVQELEEFLKINI